MIFVSLAYPIKLPEMSKEDECIEVYFKKTNRLSIYDINGINDYQVDEILGNNRDFNIVYGFPFSGKTCITKRLGSKFGYTVIDIGEFIEKIKEIKAGPDGEKDSITVEFPMFLEEFKIKLDSLPTSQKIIVDNLNKIITKSEELAKFFDVTGPIRVFYNLVCDLTVLLDRYKVVSGNADDMNDEQKEEYVKTNHELPSAFLDIINKRCVKKIDINTQNSESKTFVFLDQLLGKKLIALTHDYNLEIESTLYYLATTHKILYVNVPELIRRQYILNNEWALRLKNTFTEKKLIHDKSKVSKEELVYYDYNPIHFQNKVILDLINSYVNSNSKEIEDSKNIVILSGFLNNHLLGNMQTYNLPLFEVNDLLSLGNLFNELHRRNIFVCSNDKKSHRDSRKGSSVPKTY